MEESHGDFLALLQPVPPTYVDVESKVNSGIFHMLMQAPKKKKQQQEEERERERERYRKARPRLWQFVL